MFFCFGKKIYATHWYKNLLGKFFGAQGYFFQNPTIEFTNLLVKQWCEKFPYKFIRQLHGCLKKDLHKVS